MSEIIFSGPDEGEPLGRSLLRAALDEISVFDYTLDAESEAGEPHIHKRHVDAFLVIEGEVDFPVGPGRSSPATAGSLVLAPPGVVHAFPRALTKRARLLNLHTPGGFHDYIRALNELRANGQEPTSEFLERHDIFPTPWPADQEP